MKLTNREQALQTVSAFLGEEHKITEIIKYCNLQPALPSWKKWIDHAGNSIIINHDKSVKISSNDPLKKDKTIITDLFQKAHPNSIANRSKWAFIAFGTHNSNNINSCLFWFIGYDNNLRFVSLVDNEWQANRSALETNLDILSIVIENVDLNKKIDIINMEVCGVKLQKAFACLLPLNEFYLKMISDYDIGDYINELCHRNK